MGSEFQRTFTMGEGTLGGRTMTTFKMQPGIGLEETSKNVNPNVFVGLDQLNPAKKNSGEDAASQLTAGFEEKQLQDSVEGSQEN